MPGEIAPTELDVQMTFAQPRHDDRVLLFVDGDGRKGSSQEDAFLARINARGGS